MTHYIEDDYIEDAETCEWLWEGHLCCIDDPDFMCGECPNLTSEQKQRREEAYREFLKECSELPG